jgi:predicted nucleic acid-binding Zn ribbon protein
MNEKCIYCGEPIYPDDEVVSKISGMAHIECSEREDPEEND